MQKGMRINLLAASAIISLLAACSSGGESKPDVRTDGGRDTATVDTKPPALDTNQLSDAALPDAAPPVDTNEPPIDATEAALVELSLTAPAPSIHVGGTLPISAFGLYSDGTRKELTGKVTWTVSPASAATISASGILAGVAAGTAKVKADFAGASASLDVTITALPVVLAAIQVTATPTSIDIGTTAKMTATGTYSDGSKRDITVTATWTSSAPAVATVSAGGVATGVAEGTTVIKAAADGMEGSATLTVTKPTATLASIAVTAPATTLAIGAQMTLVATGTYSDGSKKDLSALATWTSSSAATATAAAAGVVTGVAAGSVTFKAAYQGKEGTVAVTVVTPVTITAIAATAASGSVPAGNQVQLTATATKSDGSKQDVTKTVTWTSGTPAVATVDANGLATTIKAGTVVFTAKLDTLTATVSVTVTTAVLATIDVTPALPSIAVGTTQAFVATGTYTDATKHVITDQVDWTSSTTAVATISGAPATRGVATARAKGTTTITASLSGKSGSTTLTVTDATLESITVTPSSSVIAKNTTVQLKAVGTYTDNSTKDLTADCTWSTSAANVATVSNAAGSDGLVSGVAAGTASIVASLGSVADSASVRVTNATLFSIAITPAAATIAAGTDQQFTARGTFSDGSQQDITTLVNWTSTDTTVATIENSAGKDGLAKALKGGATTIGAALSGVSAIAALTVSPATLQSIAIVATYLTIARNTTSQFTATGTYSDGSKQDITDQVTWTSSSPSVATIDNSGTDGLATGIIAGTTTITGAYAGKSAQLTLTVTAASLSSLAITPAAPTLVDGTTKALTVTGTFSDGSKQNLTTQANWSTDAPDVATVSNATGEEGVVKGESEGKATIVAALFSRAATVEVTVTKAERASIAIDQATPKLAAGTLGALTATATYTNGTTEDVTALVTWASATTSIATISNATNQRGQATAVAAGTSVITITLGTLTANVTLTVTSATLSSLVVTPATGATVAVGETVAFTATGTFSDATTQNLTIQATWGSGAATIATISSSSPTDGVATGVAEGSTTVSATLLGKTASAPLTVTP